VNQIDRERSEESMGERDTGFVGFAGMMALLGGKEFFDV
jgi:hypothetical protein